MLALLLVSSSQAVNLLKGRYASNWCLSMELMSDCYSIMATTF